MDQPATGDHLDGAAPRPNIFETSWPRRCFSLVLMRNLRASVPGRLPAAALKWIQEIAARHLRRVWLQLRLPQASIRRPRGSLSPLMVRTVARGNQFRKEDRGTTT